MHGTPRAQCVPSDAVVVVVMLLGDAAATLGIVLLVGGSTRFGAHI